MKRKRCEQNTELVYQVEQDLHSVKMASLIHRSWIIDLYEEYCTALFYITFQECSKNFYASITKDFMTVLSSMKNLVWKSIEANSIYPSPINFESERIFIRDGIDGTPIADFKQNK